MGKWIKHIIALALLVFLLSYLGKHWEQLKVLFKFKPSGLVMLYVLTGLGTVNNSRVGQILLKALNVRISLWEATVLQNAARLLNYVPMKFGTVLRANYLKHRYGLSYTGFLTMFMYIMVLMVAAAAIIGLAGLIVGYGLGGHENKILAGLFVVMLTGSLFLVFMPLPVPTGSGRLVSIIKNLLAGHRAISLNIKLIILCVVHLMVTFLLSACRIGIIYRSMGQDVHVLGYLILGTLGYCSLVVSLTPGALGVRELILGCVAVVLDIPFEVGILTAMVERAIMLSWTFVVGGGCSVWLWHKYPADFKRKGG
jgi:uncharacterized membrane protein YbhN (UPF0104 family)